MNQDKLSASQINQLRAAGHRFNDQQIDTGDAGGELWAGFRAAEEIGVVSGSVVIGVAKHLARHNRRKLYGHKSSNKILDQQG